MNIYEAVKSTVSTRQAAEAYGMRVNRSSMACCPFHSDETPSMKLDKRFHCFGCGADGDVINFTARLFNLNSKEAAEKLAADFSVGYEDWKPPDRKKQRQSQLQILRKIQYEETEKKFYRVYTDYYHLLKRWKEEFAPKSPDGIWDERFCEALQNMTQVEYLLDSFLAAGAEEKLTIMNDHRKEAKEIEKRIQKYKSGSHERSARDNGGSRSGDDRHAGHGDAGDNQTRPGSEYRGECRNDHII